MQRGIPDPAPHKGREIESPLLNLIRSCLNWVHEIFRFNTFADIFTIDHVFAVEADDEGWAFGGLGLYIFQRSDLDRALGVFFELVHDVCLMAFVVWWNLWVIVKETVFDHEQPTIGKYSRFATFLHHFAQLKKVGVCNALHISEFMHIFIDETNTRIRLFDKDIITANSKDHFEMISLFWYSY